MGIRERREREEAPKQEAEELGAEEKERPLFPPLPSLMATAGRSREREGVTFFRLSLYFPLLFPL